MPRAPSMRWRNSPASPSTKPTRPTISRTTAPASSVSRRTKRCRRPMSGFWSTSTCRGSRAECRPHRDSFWAHIDIDTLKPGSPMWTFPGNLRMQGDSGRILEQVLEVLKAKATPRFKAAAAARLPRIKAARERAHRPRRQARGGQRQARRDQSALSDGGARQAARRRGHDLQRRHYQRRRGAVANSAPAAQHHGARRRRRARLVRRHGARRQACRARTG